MRFNGAKLPFIYDSGCWPYSVIPRKFLDRIPNLCAEDFEELNSPAIYETHTGQKVVVSTVASVEITLMERNEAPRRSHLGRIREIFGVVDHMGTELVLISDSTLSEFGIETIDERVYKYLKDRRIRELLGPQNQEPLHSTSTNADRSQTSSPLFETLDSRFNVINQTSPLVIPDTDRLAHVEEELEILDSGSNGEDDRGSEDAELVGWINKRRRLVAGEP
jgi:hypothetical protein